MANLASCRYPFAAGGSVPAGFWRAVETLAAPHARGTCFAFPYRYNQRHSNSPFSITGRPAEEALLDALWIRPTAALVGHYWDMVL